MSDDEFARVLFSLIEEAHVYEPDPIIAERDALMRFAELYRQWEENH